MIPHTPVTPTQPPVAWPEQWQWPRANRAMLLGVVACVVALALGAVTWNIPVMVASAMIGGICALLWGDSKVPGRTSTLVNAVTLTEATELPPDSWVHFFRERRRSVGVVVTLVAVGAALVGAGIAGWLVDRFDSAETGVLVRIVSTVIGAIGVLFVLGGTRAAVGRKRLGSFGERPLGVALGETALLFATVTGDMIVPWRDVVAVRAEQSSGSARSSKRGVMWLRLNVRRADGSDAPVMLAPASSDVHPWVTYAAIVLAVTDENFRASLGTARAQEQLDSWSAYAAARRRAA